MTFKLGFICNSKRRVTVLGQNGYGGPAIQPAASVTVTVQRKGRLLVAWGSQRSNVTAAFPVTVSLNGNTGALASLGSDFSYTGTSANGQGMIGWSYADVDPGTYTVLVQATTTSGTIMNSVAVMLIEGYRNALKFGFARSNTGDLSSGFQDIVPNSELIMYAAYKNNNNPNGYRHTIGRLIAPTSISGAVRGIHAPAGTDWSGGNISKLMDVVIGSTTSTPTNYFQSGCYLYN